MAIGGGMSCVKYLLFCFNLLFAVTGLIILIAGIKAQINAYPYTQLTDENFFLSAPIVLIIVGIIIFVVSFFGCCGAVKENHCMIITFSIFLLAIFVAEMAVGIAGFVKRHDLEQSIVRNLNETLKEYPVNPDVKKSFDVIQTDLSCCGLNGPSDWPNNNLTWPDTCCAAQVIHNNGTTTPCTPESPNFHKDGCLVKLTEHLNDILIVLGGIALGISIIQLLGVIFACCLARSIRSQYETV